MDTIVNGPKGSEALPSTVDARHPIEGVVVRVESEHGTQWLKHKSVAFGILEGYLKDRDEYIDTEEAS